MTMHSILQTIKHRLLPNGEKEIILRRQRQVKGDDDITSFHSFSHQRSSVVHWVCQAGALLMWSWLITLTLLVYGREISRGCGNGGGLLLDAFFLCGLPG